MFKPEEMNTVVNEAMEPTMDIVEASTSNSGKGTIGFIVLGTTMVAGTALAVKGIMWGMKALKNLKANKELRQPEEVVEITDEQIEEVTK